MSGRYPSHMSPATSNVGAAVHIPTLLDKVTGGEDLSTDEAVAYIE